MTEENKFLFTLVFDGDYSEPGTIKYLGKELRLRSDAQANAAAIKEIGPQSVARLEQLTFYQDPAPSPTRAVLTGVADFTDLYKVVAEIPKLLDENDNPVAVNPNGIPTRAKVIKDFFEPLVKVVVDDHRAATSGSPTSNSAANNNSEMQLPKFTWVVVPLQELCESNTLHSEGMEGISGD